MRCGVIASMGVRVGLCVTRDQASAEGHMDGPLTLTEAAQAVAAGAITSVELTRRCLARISAQASLGAFVHVNEDQVLAAAARCDRDARLGRPRGLLHGLPIAVKDVFATKDAPTTANSRALKPAWGGGEDAEAVARLREAGAVIVGKATTNEFACGPPDPATGFPLPRNPWNPSHTPDGSSSGSCIAVAAGLALGAIGTDSAGSLRAPAAANGVTGLKPTWGLVGTSGTVPLADSLDTVGPIGRSAQDCALLLAALTGAEPVPLSTSEGLRVGVARSGFFSTGSGPSALEAVEAFCSVLGECGAVFGDAEIGGAEAASQATLVVLAHEAFGNHRERLKDRWSDYGAATREFLSRGGHISTADVRRALCQRSHFRAQMTEILQRYDVLITPSSAAPAARLDSEVDPNAVQNLDAPWNLLGLPAVAVPCGFERGLPLSVQVVGPRMGDHLVLSVADAVQRRTSWHLEVPRGMLL